MTFLKRGVAWGNGVISEITSALSLPCLLDVPASVLGSRAAAPSPLGLRRLMLGVVMTFYVIHVLIVNPLNVKQTSLTVYFNQFV